MGDTTNARCLSSAVSFVHCASKGEKGDDVDGFEEGTNVVGSEANRVQGSRFSIVSCELVPKSLHVDKCRGKSDPVVVVVAAVSRSSSVGLTVSSKSESSKHDSESSCVISRGDGCHAAASIVVVVVVVSSSKQGTERARSELNLERLDLVPLPLVMNVEFVRADWALNIRVAALCTSFSLATEHALTVAGTDRSE